MTVRALVAECTKGTRGLLASRNGVMAIVTLTVASVLCWFHRIDGNAYAAVMTIVSGLYTFTRSRYQPPPPQFPPYFGPNP